MTLDSAGLEGVSSLRRGVSPSFAVVVLLRLRFQQAGRSYYLFLNYMLFNYMSV